MDFMSAVKKCLNPYFSVDGRAPRSEYWWFFLFNFLLAIVANVIDAILLATAGIAGLSVLVGLGLLVPGVCVAIRRLHDTDKSGWFLLLGFIPVLGAIILLVFMIMEGTKGSNKFGANPLGG